MITISSPDVEPARDGEFTTFTIDQGSNRDIILIGSKICDVELMNIVGF